MGSVPRSHQGEAAREGVADCRLLVSAGVRERAVGDGCLEDRVELVKHELFERELHQADLTVGLDQSLQAVPKGPVLPGGKLPPCRHGELGQCQPGVDVEAPG